MQNFLSQQPFQQYRQLGFKVVPVANEMEMNNITVDFNGNPTYFHNQNLNEIYVKQFDIKTGLTTTQKFIKFDVNNNSSSAENNKIDMSVYDDKFNAINERIDSLYELIENRGGKK